MHIAGLCVIVFRVFRLRLDPTDRKLFTLLCPKFPSRPQSRLSENDGAGPLNCMCAAVTCDITTLISFRVVVKSLWMGWLDNGKERKMRVRLWCCCSKEAASGRCMVFLSFLLNLFDCNFFFFFCTEASYLTINGAFWGDEGLPKQFDSFKELVLITDRRGLLGAI